MIGSLLKFPIFMLLFSSGRRFLATALTAILLLVAFWHWGPQRVDLSAKEQTVLAALVDDAVAQFPTRADMGISGFVQMVSDREQWAPLVTDAIREKVMNSPDGTRKFDIQAPGFFERVARTLGFSTTMRGKTMQQLQEMAKRLDRDTDALLVVRFGGAGCYVEDAAGNASGRLECIIVFKDGRVPLTIVATGKKLQQDETVAAAAETALHTMPTARRCLWALGFVLLFPFLAAPVTGAVIRRGSAQANLFMVGAYTIIEILAVLALAGAPSGWTQSILMAAAMCGCLVYTLCVCEMFAKPEYNRRKLNAAAI